MTVVEASHRAKQYILMMYKGQKHILCSDLRSNFSTAVNPFVLCFPNGGAFQLASSRHVASVVRLPQPGSLGVATRWGGREGVAHRGAGAGQGGETGARGGEGTCFSSATGKSPDVGQKWGHRWP